MKVRIPIMIKFCKRCDKKKEIIGQYSKYCDACRGKVGRPPLHSKKEKGGVQ